MKRKLVWLLVSGLMVAVLLAASCAPAVTKEEEVAPPEEEAVAEEEESVTLGPFRVGETAQTDKLAVTVTEMYLADSYEYYSVSSQKTITRPAGPGTSYLFANIRIKNLDSAASYRLPLVPHTQWGAAPASIRGGYTGGSHATGSYYGADRLPEGAPMLPPGGEIEGKVLFIIPAGQTGHWVDYRLQIYPDIWAQWLLE